jgi:hypothetical protein
MRYNFASMARISEGTLRARIRAELPVELHHGHTNVPGVDPDRYERIEDLEGTHPVLRWLTTCRAPGSGRHYAGYDALVNPLTGETVTLARVDDRLRRADPHTTAGARS